MWSTRHSCHANGTKFPPTGLVSTRIVMLLLMACAAGCSSLGPYRGPLTSSASPAPEAAPETASTVTNIPEDRPNVVESVPEPEPTAPPPRARILVLRSSDATNYQDVAMGVDQTLADRYDLHQASLADGASRAEILDAEPGAWNAAIAIGMDAAEFAGANLGVPTVFCQVFDYEQLLARHGQLFGVEAMPPLELQLRSWKQIAENSSTLGIIVTAQESALLEAARHAAADAGIELHAALAKTDRDALYQFKRFAQSVDGIWLLPNSTILSPRVLREILEYALSHHVQSIVFDKALLEWGALVSVGSDPSDVAETVARVLAELIDGDPSALDRVSPLTRVDVHVNQKVLSALDLSSAPGLVSGTAQVTARANER